MSKQKDKRNDFCVLDAGLYTSVQDGGRIGYRTLGVPSGGALDLDAMRLANTLVGNPDDEPVLECTGVGPTLRFEGNVCFAICGASVPVWVDNHIVPSGRPIWIRRGATVRIGAVTVGYRAYVAVRGGMNVQRVMGSASTLARFGLGGICGRPLQKGDRISVPVTELPASNDVRQIVDGAWTTRWGVQQQPVAAGRVHIRAMDGEQANELSHTARQTFWAGEFRVEARSDRMGIHLDGPTIEAPGGQMVSEPVVPGSVQVPPSGHPILLLADCQTTGGYPKIATVAQVDFGVLAQVRPGTIVSFMQVELDFAMEAYRAHVRRINALLKMVEGRVYPLFQLEHSNSVKGVEETCLSI